MAYLCVVWEWMSECESVCVCLHNNVNTEYWHKQNYDITIWGEQEDRKYACDLSGGMCGGGQTELTPHYIHWEVNRKCLKQTKVV